MRKCLRRENLKMALNLAGVGASCSVVEEMWEMVYILVVGLLNTPAWVLKLTPRYNTILLLLIKQRTLRRLNSLRVRPGFYQLNTSSTRQSKIYFKPREILCTNVYTNLELKFWTLDNIGITLCRVLLHIFSGLASFTYIIHALRSNGN